MLSLSMRVSGGHSALRPRTLPCTQEIFPDASRALSTALDAGGSGKEGAKLLPARRPSCSLEEEKINKQTHKQKCDRLQ